MPTDSEIKKMKRGELDALATKLGIKPDAFSRAEDLRTAIFKQRASAAAEESAATEPAGTKPVKAGSKTARAKGKAEQKGAKAAKVKQPQKPTRPRHERRGKRNREAYNQVDRAKEYTLNDAIQLAQATATTKFDESIELHVNLGVDPKQADQVVRGTVVLPHGSGKVQRVAVLADAGGQKAAKAAGAEKVGFEDLLKEIEQGQIDFDILVATPEVMPKLAKYGQVLGPRGLMPNPKSGTVSANIEKTIQELKAGRLQFRIDQGGIVHLVIGKASFKSADLVENTKAVLRAIQEARPSTVKATYLQKITVAASMGPGIKISPTQALGEL